MTSNSLSPASIHMRRENIVLLIDDQPTLGRTVGDMLQAERDIDFYFCQHPADAMALAEEIWPTVILQDLAMPGIDGLALLKQFRANPSTCDIPLIMLSGKNEPITKATAFRMGADDYLVKLPDRVELIARIRHHSKNYFTHLEQAEAVRKLEANEHQMAFDMAQAAADVRSLLPAPIDIGPVQVDWRLVPSAQLGGDALGYQWLDERHFAFYLLDVAGHGVGASLLAVTILNTLNHQILPQTDFHDPAAVMRGLNKVFAMHKHGWRFFTIFYGVYDRDKQILTYSGGGHPPALCFVGSESSQSPPTRLSASAPPIGVLEESLFSNKTVALSAGAKILLYSDGVVELPTLHNERLGQESFYEFAREISSEDDLLERILKRTYEVHNKAMVDDCTLMLLDFP